MLAAILCSLTLGSGHTTPAQSNPGNHRTPAGRGDDQALDLLGSVNAERAGDRLTSSPGGHFDFLKGTPSSTPDLAPHFFSVTIHGLNPDETRGFIKKYIEPHGPGLEVKTLTPKPAKQAGTDDHTFELMGTLAQVIGARENIARDEALQREVRVGGIARIQQVEALVDQAIHVLGL